MKKLFVIFYGKCIFFIKFFLFFILMKQIRDIDKTNETLLANGQYGELVKVLKDAGFFIINISF